MNTAVLVFEKEESLCFPTLIETIDSFPFGVRIFPLLVRDGEILKRWALIEAEEERAFVEKEEKIPTAKEFIEVLKGPVCIITLEMCSYLQMPMYFVLSRKDKAASMFIEHTKVRMEKIESIYSGIFQSVVAFFSKKKITLQGIRVKNQQGKKETIETDIYIDKPPHGIPEEMIMVHKTAEGKEVKKCLCHMQSKLLQKILQRNSLIFAGDTGAVYLRLEMQNTGNGQIYAAVVKTPLVLSIVDSFQGYMKEQHNRAFLLSLQHRYGDEIKPITDAFIYRDEKDLKAAFDSTLISQMGYSYDTKHRVLEGVMSLLCTLKFPPSDKRASLLASLKKIYTEEIKTLKKEGLKIGSSILLLPSLPTETTSLQYLIREERSTSKYLSEKTAKSFCFSPK
ncbi:hypothetical protein NECID01_1311 [Nematocida sp. AWRm77]|nr:hypothetical protein NECID01_1311 [Nematocida sp. AWRm77]